MDKVLLSVGARIAQSFRKKFFVQREMDKTLRINFLLESYPQIVAQKLPKVAQEFPVLFLWEWLVNEDSWDFKARMTGRAGIIGLFSDIPSGF